MFKNATVFKINELLFSDSNTINLQLEANSFEPCGASQEKSVGWVPPRGEVHGPMVEVVGGQYIMRLMIETKTVPTATVKEKVDAQCEQLEATTGRKPGKKERRELAEDARLALLPMAFTKRTAVTVWLNPVANLLWVNTTSQSRIDTALTCLISAIDGLTLHLVQTKSSPSAVMTSMLTAYYTPNHDTFSAGRACELKACDDSKAAIRYKNYNLDCPEIDTQIAQGAVVKSLHLTWNDRVTFTLTDTGAIKGLVYLDVIFEKDFESGFDADVSIATGELTALQIDLVVLMGGEVVA